MNLWQRITGRRPRSANAAKERLQLVVIHDRAGISPGKLETMKDDLIDAVSRHVEIDQAAVKVSLTQERDHQKLIVDIPLAASRARRRESR